MTVTCFGDATSCIIYLIKKSFQENYSQIQLTWPGCQQLWTSCCQIAMPAGHSPSAGYQPDETKQEHKNRLKSRKVQSYFQSYSFYYVNLVSAETLGRNPRDFVSSHNWRNNLPVNDDNVSPRHTIVWTSLKYLMLGLRRCCFLEERSSKQRHSPSPLGSRTPFIVPSLSIPFTVLSKTLAKCKDNQMNEWQTNILTIQPQLIWFSILFHLFHKKRMQNSSTHLKAAKTKRYLTSLLLHLSFKRCPQLRHLKINIL